MEGDDQALLLTRREDAPLVARLEGVLLMDGTGSNEPFVATVTISPEGRIASIQPAPGATAQLTAEPSVVNTHAHGLVPGTPLFSSGSAPPSNDQVMENLATHLRQGTGTIISVDNLVNPAAVRAVRERVTALDIFTLSNVNSHALCAARAVDGAGLAATPLPGTEAQLQDNGDIVLGVGEVGSGATYLGGVASYRIIPSIVRERCSIELGEREGEALKLAVYDLRTLAVRDAPDEQAHFREVAKGLGIPLDAADDIRTRIIERLSPAIHEEMASTRHAAELAARTGVPMLVHTGLPSLKVIEQVADLPPVLVLGHANHPSIPPDEALAWARRIKERRKGPTYVEASTFNSVNGGFDEEVASFERFLAEGVVDIVSTDYGGGHHDPIRERVLAACRARGLDYWRQLPSLTSTPARVYGLDVGVLEEGCPADIVITGVDEPARTLAVIKRGRQVFRAERAADALENVVVLA